MRFVAIIFARGGSKGVPGKNIKLFNGKPLLAWAIDCALSVPYISRVLVSTDDLRIAECALRFGAEVPFMRPTELARDDSPEWECWRHSLRYLASTADGLPDGMVSVPTTSPLRSPKDIERCINKFKLGLYDGVVTVSEARRNPYFNMVSSRPDGTLQLVSGGKENYSRRQDVPEVYDLTTVAYVFNPKYVLQSKSMWNGKVGYVAIPPERSIDIDTPLDFEIAEYIHKKKRDE